MGTSFPACRSSHQQEQPPAPRGPSTRRIIGDCEHGSPHSQAKQLFGTMNGHSGASGETGYSALPSGQPGDVRDIEASQLEHRPSWEEDELCEHKCVGSCVFMAALPGTDAAPGRPGPGHDQL